MRFVTDKDAIKGLANAVILQACQDYPDYDTKAFFYSEWFLLLSRGCVNPDAIIKYLESEAGKRNGKKFFKENVI